MTPARLSPTRKVFENFPRNQTPVPGVLLLWVASKPTERSSYLVLRVVIGDGVPSRFDASTFPSTTLGTTSASDASNVTRCDRVRADGTWDGKFLDRHEPVVWRP